MATDSKMDSKVFSKSYKRGSDYPRGKEGEAKVKKLKALKRKYDSLLPSKGKEITSEGKKKRAEIKQAMSSLMKTMAD